MKIFKFGGASVKDAAGVKNVAEIIKSYSAEPLLVVVSAMGKTTNLLEKLVKAYYNGEESAVKELYAMLLQQHRAVIEDLFEDRQHAVFADFNNLMEELQDSLQEPSSENFDYEYDQIVSYGELLSSKIVAAYLNYIRLDSVWTDARRLVRTNNVYREGTVDWEYTQSKIHRKVMPNYTGEKWKIVVTQGFIGGTSEGLTTTLGREGSDFSAAIFAFSLNAEDVTIWKDVEGLLNADPKQFPDTVKLDRISYQEAIELAYYGASIIHPKTLKPLQNKNIPLHVKSFLHPAAEGSIIGNFAKNTRVPCYICKQSQVLISIMPKDFSFIAEENLSTIFALVAHFGIKINLMQNSAISFSICVDNRYNMQDLIEELQTEFFVKYNTGMELYTIRHYDKNSIAEITRKGEVLLEQKNRSTVQYVIRKEEQ
ncbi:MAG: aspartate kinase [Bacteroidales bacterium]|nr:aspartate kinase [Bacteroidales bacterium]